LEKKQPLTLLLHAVLDLSDSRAGAIVVELTPGAPLTPNPPIVTPSTVRASPPTGVVTFGSGVDGTVLAGALAIRSATAFVLSSLRESVREAAE
jgi:hypothetical protein